MTKPLRSLSKGIEAHFGSEDSLKAFMEVKPPIPKGVILASHPPARATSR